MLPDRVKDMQMTFLGRQPGCCINEIINEMMIPE